MIKTITIKECHCDICGAEVEEKDLLTIRYPSIAHPDPSTCTRPQCYISESKLDTCRECIGKIVMLHRYVDHFEVRTPTKEEIYGEEAEKADN